MMKCKITENEIEIPVQINGKVKENNYYSC